MFSHIICFMKYVLSDHLFRVMKYAFSDCLISFMKYVLLNDLFSSIKYLLWNICFVLWIVLSCHLLLFSISFHSLLLSSFLSHHHMWDVIRFYIYFSGQSSKFLVQHFRSCQIKTATYTWQHYLTLVSHQIY